MRIGLLIVLTAALLGCSAGPPLEEISDPGKTIVPRSGNGIVLAAETESDLTETVAAPPPADLKVQLPDGYLPSQVLTANLELDESEEQIIVFKRRDDPEDRIRLLVVSFDPIRNNWIQAWEGKTIANNVRSFTLYTSDVTGDHAKEIVCFGINDNGEQTLDVFRRTSNPLGLGLSYSSILSVSADVNISIEEVQRSEAFDAMETFAAPSYPIVVERRDPDAQNAFGTIKTSYFWDLSKKRYMPGLEEHISGDVIEDSRLRTLYEGTEADFEAFLDGPWYRGSSTGNQVDIAYFGTADRVVVFNSGHLQQVFNWDDSAKTLYGRGIQLFVTNELLRSLKRLISVRVTELNKIEVIVQDSDGLNGTYERLTPGLQATALNRGETGAVLSDLRPRGLFASDTGMELVFGDSGFTMREGDHVGSGGYVVYRVDGETVLELMFVDENRLPVESRAYAVEYREVTDGDRTVRTLTLSPGELGISGFSSLSTDQITMEQIEVSERQTPDVQ